MTSEWQYLLRIVGSDVADFERFLMGILLKHPSVGSTSSRFFRSIDDEYQTALPVNYKVTVAGDTSGS